MRITPEFPDYRYQDPMRQAELVIYKCQLRVQIDPPCFIAQRFCQCALCSLGPSGGWDSSCSEGNNPACRLSLNL